MDTPGFQEVLCVHHRTSPETERLRESLEIEARQPDCELSSVESATSSSIRTTPFSTRAGKVLTHRQILREVWGANYVEQTHYLRVYLAHLREKLEANPAHPELFITEPGVGYRLVEKE